MDVRKCCVKNCSSTNATHRLFCFPKDDKLRELWLSYVIPTNKELSGLSKHQLLSKRVCQNHFDRYQFDGMGNRLRYGYPCLFSEKEISFGIPLSSTVNDHLSDHNYYLSSAPKSPTLVTSHIREKDTVESDVQNDLEDKQATSSLIENPLAIVSRNPG